MILRSYELDNDNAIARDPSFIHSYNKQLVRLRDLQQVFIKNIIEIQVESV